MCVFVRLCEYVCGRGCMLGGSGGVREYVEKKRNPTLKTDKKVA